MKLLANQLALDDFLNGLLIPFLADFFTRLLTTHERATFARRTFIGPYLIVTSLEETGLMLRHTLPGLSREAFSFGLTLLGETLPCSLHAQLHCCFKRRGCVIKQFSGSLGIGCSEPLLERATRPAPKLSSSGRPQGPGARGGRAEHYSNEIRTHSKARRKDGWVFVRSMGASLRRER